MPGEVALSLGHLTRHLPPGGRGHGQGHDFMSDDFSGEVRPEVSLPSPLPRMGNFLARGNFFFNFTFLSCFFFFSPCFLFFSFDFLIQVLLCSPGRPQTQSPPASVP